VSNKSDQAERRALAGSTTTSTYFHQSQIAEQLDAPGGRFREKETITGSELVPQYPRLPAGSPWSGDGVGVEAPLGASVDAMEPCGEAFEVERSSVLAATPGEKAEVAPMLAAASPVDVVETPRPIPSAEATIRRRKI
jgi:hypothetical protein